MNGRIRICLVCSASMTYEAFLSPWARGLATIGDVTVLMNGKPARPESHPARFIEVGIEREVNPLRDLAALWTLFRQFRQQRFDAVHSVTPKAGLLAMVAAAMAGVPHRHHTFTGQVWATKTGLSRWFLKMMDRVIVWSATEVLADSPSQLQFLVEEGVVRPGAGRVLGNGSICGVATDRFKPDSARRARLRAESGLRADSLVCLYIGRMKVEKGVLDLAAAFVRLAREFPDTSLLLVGHDEENLRPRIERLLSDAGKQVVFIGQSPHPEHHMQAADLLCLPSYREGFGNVIIEAAACGLPCLGSRIYGISDAVEDGVTGCLHARGSPDELYELMRQMRIQPERRCQMGAAAQARAERLFSESAVIGSLVAFYRDRLRK